MKPLKTLIPIARGLLRFSAIAIVYSNGDIQTTLLLKFNSIAYFISLFFTIFSILLYIGGFLKSSNVTIISSLLLIVLCAIDLLVLRGFNVPDLISIIPLASIGFYFFAKGNGN